MGKKAATIGDIGTDHDGYPPTKIITGSPDVLIDGKPVARVSDQLEPHTKPGSSPHPRAIASGSSTVFINGLPMAITGGSIDCGGVIIGSSTVVVGDMAPAARRMSSPAPTEQAATTTTKPKIAPVLDDWKPIPGYRGLIYHTKRQMDDYQADDLQSGDMSMGDIMKLGEMYNFAFTPDAFAYPPSVHFGILRAAVQFVSIGEYGPIIGQLINHFEGSSGTTYTDPLLDKAMKTHVTTQTFTNRIQTLIGERLTAGDGALSPDDREPIQAGLNNSVSLPKFDTLADWVNGLGIAVHDVYAVKVELTELEYKGREFRGILTYQVQDHFGLDDLDVNGGKRFEYLAPFRSWFLLQRYNRYAYKPFITEMNFTADIKGSF
ncbi:type VI secretion system PAAR protein [Aeromonas popoffii]|uniref:type VI secretion system PAAR protein n=1 Tax=Aeromonas popoffii TaxID=70856 RepID=UPI0030CE644A